MALVLSLAAAIVYGAGDFLGGFATKRAPVVTVVFGSQLAGLAILAIALPLVPGTFRFVDVAYGAAAGVLGAIAVALLYRGLAVGAMGIVSPITAVLAAAVPAIYGIATGERPTAVALAGIVLALIAVVVVSFSGGVGRTARGVPEAIAAGLLFAAFFIVLARTSADAGLWPLVGARGVSIVVFALVALAVRVTLVPPPGARATVFFGGLFDMLANVLYVLAVHTGLIAIVAVVTSLYPASTVALAGIVLRERLSARQWIGVGCAFAGVATIALAR
jgi:drug/metabolite transporter (DMT)-like permease